MCKRFVFFFRERAESLFGWEKGVNRGCRGRMQKGGVNRAAKRPHAKKGGGVNAAKRGRFAALFTPPFLHAAASQPCSRHAAASRPCSHPLFRPFSNKIQKWERKVRKHSRDNKIFFKKGGVNRGLGINGRERISRFSKKKKKTIISSLRNFCWEVNFCKIGKFNTLA